MRLTAFFLLVSCLQLSAAGFSQSVTLAKKTTTLSEVFKEIRKQTGYVFVYNDNMLPDQKRFEIRVKNVSISEALETCLKDLPLTYSILSNHTVVIRPKKQPPAILEALLVNAEPITGKILDDKGKPVAFASVVIKETQKGTSTDKDGQFSIDIDNNAATIVISYVGFKTLELKAWRGNRIIQLEPAVEAMEDLVVSTGMFKRDKQTFTGAVASFTGKQLKQIGNLNVLQSLKTLDPSFMIISDNLLGANPNQIPQIEVRGKTSLSTNTVRDQFSNDPNQPLFILNGMETTLRQIIDLDINRVQSITLLKDAASTALYGSRAANGVLIVETVPPQAGELRVTYTGDFRFEMADLRDYNMMDAAENLEFQKQAGLYVDASSVNKIYLDNLYNSRLAEVKKGVNSYWLNAPIRTGITNGHSVRVAGGSNEFQYGASLSYRNLQGVMKGSDRNNWSGTIDLTYRKKKLNITNQTYINGYDANESPFGSFRTYANTNPYYRKQKADGSPNLDKYLEIYWAPRTNGFIDTTRVANPLYNASLNSENNSTSLNIQNNIAAIYDLNTNWRVSAGLQVTKAVTTNIYFLPSANTAFDNAGVFEKGSYTNTRSDLSGYQGNVMLTYRKVLNDVHSLTGNIRSEIQRQRSTSNSYTATGFPIGVDGNPAFAFGYAVSGKPAYSEVEVRRVNALGSFNYAYDNKYYADLNYRIDGSTAFGTQNKYSPFWSFGLGWTVSRENFMKQVRRVDLLRIRGNIGTSGNQALGSFASSSVYRYEANVSIFGQGLNLYQLGNPLLEWQNTRSTSVGIDASLFGNKLTATLNAYEKLSSPLITQGSVPASTGVSTHSLNVGELNTRGLEAIIRYSPVYKQRQNLVWTLGLTGSMYKSKYAKFSNILKNMNEEAQKSASLSRYYDGYSPDELWAVTSLSIDPATGKEVFLKKNGERSFLYSAEDLVPQGNGRPQVEGVISSNLNIKGLLIGINLRYSLSNYIFNQALYNKVENISKSDLQFNQDKRAMELRWKQPGDVAQFRGISITDVTPLSSRFIQKENYISGESINVGYEFLSKNHSWLRSSRIRSVRVNAYMNDIFRWSTIRSERGLDYPFSNALACSVNLYF